MKISWEDTEGMRGSRNRQWLFLLAVLLLVQIFVLIYYGHQKNGFHEDEYYSYYSSNRTAGLYQLDREWMESDTFFNEFVVLEGEGFNYGLVAQVQSWDVHPPLFYFFLHTACSLFPGVFSKWLGIGVNIIAFCINFVLLTWLTWHISGRSRLLTAAVAAVWGFNAVIISGVMFIRMYEWLIVFVLACACLHTAAVMRKDMSFKRFLLPLMVINYLGFLTQYYYIIFLFFMAAGFLIWSFKKQRRLSGCLRYAAACAVSLLLAVLSYPVCVAHILRGYRGTGAVSAFIDAGNTGGRLSFFSGLLNEYLFDGLLWLWLAVIVVLAVIVWLKGRRNTGGPGQEDAVREAYGLLVLGACGYFFTVSKTALMYAEASNRYQLPVYGIVQMLLIVGSCRLWEQAVSAAGKADDVKKKRIARIGTVGILLLFLAADLHELAEHKVLFLYSEDAADLAYAEENADEAVVVLYHDERFFHMWWYLLMKYERVYFVNQANQEEIADDVICTADKLIVYADDYENRQDNLKMLLDSNPRLQGYKLIKQKDIWNIYEYE